MDVTDSVKSGCGALVLVTVKVTGGELPPAGAGLVTTTANVPALARSALLSVMDSWLALTNVAVCGDPLNVTVEEATKPLPVIVRVSAPLPAEAEDGDRLATVGAGLLAACTVKLTGAEVPPPGAGFETVTGKVPVMARSLAGTVAVS
jgi:hypothetical protein